MISPARKVAYRLLRQIESRRLFSDDAINSERMQELQRRDQNLTTEIVYGCLRWQSLLDHILSNASSRSWSEVDPGARILLRMSLYQMWQLDRIPDHALVNDAVEIAKRELGKGIDGYINGILRGLARTRGWEKNDFQNAPPWIQVSLPKWLWERWDGRFGEKAATEYAISLNEPPRIALRASGKISETPFIAPSDLVPDAYIQVNRDCDLPDDLSSTLQRQDEASQLIPHLLGPLEGWSVWDCCAAPGGKSAALSMKCGASGHLTASDFQQKRAHLLIHALKSLPIRNSHILIADASLQPPFSCRFDAVLADVPCSGLGTLRRNPEIKWTFNSEEFARLNLTQRRILDSVSKAVRRGGLLLYSTCSTEPEENECVVESFLKANPEFHIIKPSYPDGIENWTGTDNMVRTFPGSRKWDGFFAVLMQNGVRY
jgi:16S rRNA (cytosine967-C5)-methyltransferase